VTDSFPARPIEILLVEDSAADAQLTREAMKSGRIANRLHHVTDGEAAMDFLAGRGRFAGSPRPDLILLDLTLPGKDGREVLADLKKDPALRSIPVVVLTASSDEGDLLRSYHLHANCCITKPMDVARFLQVIRSIENFWLTVVTLPGRT
jgi:CheY-like chemotaxis protein